MATGHLVAMSEPLSPGPVHRHDPVALPPYVSNGVLGIRLASLPHLPGTTIVSGFAGEDPNDGVEGLARAPFALATDVRLDGVWASTSPASTRLIEQRYDFSSGEVMTAWSFEVGDATARIETLCFCSRTLPGVAACRMTVRVNRPADIALVGGLDPRGVP